MSRTGRQPYETTDVAPYGAGVRRLRPPASLSEPQRAAFLDLVTTCPATQFEPSDIPLLVRWCELCVMAEGANVELQASGMLRRTGSRRPWFRIHLEATKALSNLALRLRLGPQSRASKAPKRKVGSMSYFDIMELEASRGTSEGKREPDA